MTSRNYYYLGNQRALINLHTGDSFIIDTESIDLSVSLVMYGQWESWIEKHLMQMANEGDTVVDCGANMGYYSVILGRIIGESGKLYSFEPNPRIYDILKKNLLINGLSGCTAFNMALNSKGKGNDFMWVKPHESGGGFITRDKETDISKDGFQKIDIKTGRLDDVLPIKSQVDVMKIDVEGCEPDVINGAKKVIERSQNIKLVVELSPSGWEGQGHNPTELFDYLEQCGFSFKMAMGNGTLDEMEPLNLIESSKNLGYTTCFFAARHWEQ